MASVCPTPPLAVLRCYPPRPSSKVSERTLALFTVHLFINKLVFPHTVALSELISFKEYPVSSVLRSYLAEAFVRTRPKRTLMYLTICPFIRVKNYHSSSYTCFPARWSFLVQRTDQEQIDDFLLVLFRSGCILIASNRLHLEASVWVARDTALFTWG